MDEIEYKLSSKNVVLVARTISTLVETIKQKSSEESHKKHELKELKFLKEKCVSSNSLVSLTASKGLIALVKDNILPLPSTVSDLVSLLMNAGSYPGIISAIFELLLMEPHGYNLVVPQHPMISVLLHNSATWIDIFEQLKNAHSECAENGALNQLMRPFYLFICCDFNNKVLPVFRHKLWNYLAENFVETEAVLFKELLSWQRYEDKEHLYQLNNFLMEILEILLGNERNDSLLEVILLYLASTLHEMLKKNMNPRSTLRIIKITLEEYPNLDCLNCLLILLADSIAVCPPVYLFDALLYCKTLLSLNRANNLVIKAVKSSCLHWILQSNIITSNCSDLLHEIIQYEAQFDLENAASTVKLADSLKNTAILNTNENMHLAMELCLVAENISENELAKWLQQVQKAPETLTKRIQNFLFGLLMFNFKNRDVSLAVLKVLTICVECYPEVAANFLTIILYKLANCGDSSVQYELLKTLPKMGVLKENLGIVVSTLQVFASNQNHTKLRTFTMTLFFDLWGLQIRCYPLLQSLLAQNQVQDEWEFYTTKANILMRLCEKKPELYGTELAAHLSKVLNKCKSPEGGLASSFALLGLKHLCKQGIVDIATAWTTLAPSFKNENRLEVLTSLCDLLSEVSNLPENEKYDPLIYEITGQLWKYATYHSQIEVNAAAYRALSCFTLEQISANLMDILEEPDLVPDTFGHIPGNTWIKLLQNNNYASLDSAGDLLISLVSREISGYVKGTYHIGEGRKEPANFSTLHNHSIVRALGNFVKENVCKFESNLSNLREVYLQCLRVLSKEYAKPLPPVDWCFLQELIHETSARPYCISIASHQVVLSGTARRFMENLIVSLTNTMSNPSDISSIYDNLKFLTNSIQPMLMKPFFENTFLYVKQNDCGELLQVMLRNITNLFKDKDVQDANKMVISKVIVDEFKLLHPTQESFEAFMQCIVALPEKYLNEVISLSDSSEMSSDEIELAVKVRTTITLNQKEPQFTMLDETFFIINSIPSEHSFLLSEAKTVFAKHREHQAAVDWLMEFLGQIQVNLADKKYVSIQEVLYLCDVFILAIVTFAGHDIFGHDVNKFKLFPQALSALLTNKEWNYCISQILEWLYYMTNYTSLPIDYRRIFQQGLIALRHEDIFTDSYRWMKYVGAVVKV